MAWQVLDETARPYGGDVTDQFDRDEALTAAAGRGEQPPTLRLWRCARAVALGYRDARLPAADAAAAALRTQGWAVAVRRSGGALVPLDAGVLNATLIYPGGGLDIAGGFARMHQLVRSALAPLGLVVAKGEVPGGYCPGDSDLAVGGRKFCGVSQRRKRLATGVHAFLLVEGTGAARAALAAGYYARAAGGLAPDGAYPLVRPEVMASLSELAGRPLAVPEVAAWLTAAVNDLPEPRV